MKNKSDRNKKKENPDSGVSKGMIRIFSDGEPVETRSGLNLWTTESFFQGAPGYVYIDEIVVYYSFN